MFLVMGVTGKVGGATARHLLAQGKKVRALVRDRAKAASWTDQGVELVDGDWNNAAAIERALKGVDGAFVMLPAVWAPSPDFKEAKGAHRDGRNERHRYRGGDAADRAGVVGASRHRTWFDGQRG